MVSFSILIIFFFVGINIISGTSAGTHRTGVALLSISIVLAMIVGGNVGRAISMVANILHIPVGYLPRLFWWIRYNNIKVRITIISIRGEKILLPSDVSGNNISDIY